MRQLSDNQFITYRGSSTGGGGFFFFYFISPFLFFYFYHGILFQSDKNVDHHGDARQASPESLKILS